MIINIESNKTNAYLLLGNIVICSSSSSVDHNEEKYLDIQTINNGDKRWQQFIIMSIRGQRSSWWWWWWWTLCFVVINIILISDTVTHTHTRHPFQTNKNNPEIFTKTEHDLFFICFLWFTRWTQNANFALYSFFLWMKMKMKMRWENIGFTFLDTQRSIMWWNVLLFGWWWWWFEIDNNSNTDVIHSYKLILLFVWLFVCWFVCCGE